VSPGAVAVTLQPAGVTDAAVIAALHERCLGESWQADSVARLLALPGAFALVAAAPPPAGPVGFILCVPSPPDIDIAALGVLPDRRRTGLGGRLLDAAVALARAGGAASLMLEVADDNAAALALYRGRGFAPAGRRPGYYRGPEGRRDALVLRLALLPGASSER
jgi:ribosomal-protein-alanine N-acetyltransferase